jgi:HlyD family secretion protein
MPDNDAAMRRLFIILALVSAGAAIWFWLQPEQTQTANLDQRFRFARVERGSVVQTIAATGTLNPVVLVNVGTQISGTIRSVLVDFNQTVKAGQVLAEIDPSLIEAQIAQLQANLQEVRTQFAVARRKLARSEDLASRGFISAAQVEDDKQSVDLTESRVRAIEAQVARERTNLAYTRIRSPIDGIVIARSVDVGQTVAASFQTPTLFLIARDLGNLQIDTNVAEADVAALKVGMEASFRVDALGEQRFAAQVRQIRLNPKIEQNVVTYNVVLSTRNDTGRLLPGMTANVRIEVARSDQVLRVPNTALRFRPSDSSILKPEPGSQPNQAAQASGSAMIANARRGSLFIENQHEGRAVLARLRPALGITDGTHTELLDEGLLREGDRVVTAELVGAQMPSKSGSFRLRLF